MQRTTWTAALLLDAVILPTHPANEQAGLAELGLRLAEAKQLTAALQAEMVSTQVARVGERRRVCVACGRVLASKGLTQHRCYQPQSSGVLLGQALIGRAAPGPLASPVPHPRLGPHGGRRAFPLAPVTASVPGWGHVLRRRSHRRSHTPRVPRGRRAFRRDRVAPALPAHHGQRPGPGVRARHRWMAPLSHADRARRPRCPPTATSPGSEGSLTRV